MRQDQVIAVPPLTPVIRTLVIICVVCFFLERIAGDYVLPIFDRDMISVFGLVPYSTIKEHWLWQPFTYIFFHGNHFHILLNMLILWYFGAEIEMQLGQAGFLKYFFACGVGAALFNIGVLLLFEDGSGQLAMSFFEACGGSSQSSVCIPIIGASGAIYGILAAYGIFYGNRYFLVFFLFPMKAKYFVLFVAGMELMTGMESNPAQSDNVAHFAHLGGMACGAAYIYLKFVYLKKRGNYFDKRKEKQRESLKKKFKLIVNDDKGEDDPPTWH